MQWLEQLSRAQQLAFVLILFALWCGISWRWYTCGIHGFCTLADATPQTSLPYIFAKKEPAPLPPEQCAPLLQTDLSLARHNDPSEVRALEGFLRTHTKAALASDGMFGPNDAEALRTYQKTRAHVGLAPTGSLDAATRAIINSDACTASMAMN